MRGYVSAAVGLGVVLLLALPSAEARMTENEVKSAVEKAYPVQVLQIRDIEVDGRAAYAVTVMTHGGDFDDAFQVNTFIIDADTGKLIPVFRHLDSGYVLPDGGDRDTNR